MAKEIRVDLRIARSRSGLSGADMAHLMECGTDRISKLENGVARITPQELARLHLICGGRFENTFSITCQTAAGRLFKRLGTMPKEPIHWAGKRAIRLETLDNLSRRLQAYLQKAYER